MLTGMNKFNFGVAQVPSHVYCLYDEINDMEAKNISEWIINANSMGPEEAPAVLNLFVNSPGGSLSAAWAIIDMIRGSHIPVRTVGIGQIASAGLLIFMSGQKGWRLLTENTSIMAHQFGWGSIGKYHELMATTVEYNNLQNRLLKHISKCTGLTNAEVSEKLMPASDVWLTAQEAVKLGIADKVSNLK